ncbi:NHLP bacteriocin export ABC transporter permease/ATPase subunit [Nostoc sp. MS1]|uniref:NHLP bacteriocin export ABC transporter permease/ATPase subunit n=1 Tax=Nostoc sp. MS1 TaxID=2764711 RepID=UPI001CC41B49|nr:NHLP bacteriocin export ABC transporter permease/ATPase subunit [Nostoc sp. MS1]BCL39336.1 NHLP family bacteriocin export ABC transporter permease/ATPase subunit [Nostoc sp. MS1]
MLEGLHRKQKQAKKSRQQRLEKLNQQVLQTAWQELAAPLESPSNFYPITNVECDDPLLVAAQVVGKSMGLEIVQPPPSEDTSHLKEPLSAIARASRLRTRTVILRDNWWMGNCQALVAFEDDHPVALIPNSSDRYVLFDPQTGTSEPVTEDVAMGLSPQAYMFYKPLPDQLLTAIDILKFSFRDAGKDILAVFVIGVAISLLGMFTSLAMGILIDQVILNSNRNLLWQLGLGLLAAALGVGTLQLVQNFTLIKIESKADFSTQSAVWDRVLRLKIPFFRQYTAGDLHSRVSVISTIRRTVGGATISSILNASFSLLNLGILIYYSLPLGLLAGAIGVSIFIVTITVGNRKLSQLRFLEDLRGKNFGLTIQLINGISKLRVAGAETRAFAYWSRKYSQQQRLEISTQTIENNLAVFNQVLIPLSLAIIYCFVIAVLRSQSDYSLGRFLAFNAAYATFIAGIINLSNITNRILDIVPQWERAKGILRTELEVIPNQAIDPGKLSGRLALDRVSFRYRQEGTLTLNAVSIHAEPGEFIAIVGPSGSGKSTLFRLLLGFESPMSGKVYYDNQDLATLDIERVRRQLGVVLQNSSPEAASLYENIAGSALVSLNEAWEAAENAGLADDIDAMPMGMNTVVSEGGLTLSGGQRQRLMIARALVLKPQIILFDEATSALDNHTQAIVSASLEKLAVTRIVIAHRLNTIRNADRIYVLEHGRIVQQGTFTELVNQEGLFAELAARQMI